MKGTPDTVASGLRHGAGSRDRVAAAPGARRESHPQPASSRPRRRPGPGRSPEEDDASSPQPAGSSARCRALEEKELGSGGSACPEPGEPGEPLRELPSLPAGDSPRRYPSGGWEHLQQNFWLSLPLHTFPPPAPFPVFLLPGK
ncbi:hypothetical protein NN561_001280 [Cricetulus griseus]